MVKPDWGDISSTTNFNSMPTGPGSHPLVTGFDGGTNSRPTANPNSVDSEARTRVTRVTTNATPANTRFRIKQEMETKAHKIQDSVQFQNPGTEKSRLMTSFSTIFSVAISFLNYQKQEHQTEIEDFEKEVSSLRHRIRQLESRETQALSLLQQEKSYVTQLLQDIGKLSLGVPQGPKDDQYFISKFTQIFLSIHDWVLHYYMHTTPEHFIHSGSAIQRLLGLSPVDSANIFSNYPLYAIESLVVRTIEQALFGTSVLGTTASSIESILQCMGDSCKVIRNQSRDEPRLTIVPYEAPSDEEIIQWHLQTKRMVISSKTFRSQLSQRLDELGGSIDKCLAPLASVGSKGIKRSQKLRGIIGNAANLALDCELQPSKFGMIWFHSGKDCQRDQMCDALGEIPDRKLASGEAFVSLTVSPMVFRDTKTILVKARVLRQLPAEELRSWKLNPTEQLGPPTEVAPEVSYRGRRYRR